MLKRSIVMAVQMPSTTTTAPHRPIARFQRTLPVRTTVVCRKKKITHPTNTMACTYRAKDRGMVGWIRFLSYRMAKAIHHDRHDQQ